MYANQDTLQLLRHEAKSDDDDDDLSNSASQSPQGLGNKGIFKSTSIGFLRVLQVLLAFVNTLVRSSN